MQRSYYSNSISGFINDQDLSILGELCANHTNRQLEDLQRKTWLKQIEILKNQLIGLEGQVYFEFAIPRMGKRVDNIVIYNDTVFIIEFKVGNDRFLQSDAHQVLDYTLDLKNFHEGSHNCHLVPVLVATNGITSFPDQIDLTDHKEVVKVNKDDLRSIFDKYPIISSNINVAEWESSIYKPTPTIVEAAQALYKGHDVKEISRSDAGAINLSKTTECLSEIIDNAKSENRKTICFVTGVPGAGKTLAGLNIANERLKGDEDEHAVFLSGNGPLVDVLREALARDVVATSKKMDQRITKNDAKRQTNAFIQNIHHFRDEYLKNKSAPIEKVVVFDEAQRAWNNDQVASFMKRKRGVEDFSMSEPELLVDVMNRHENWCSIICLIGGGQEINTGEAGLEEWLRALKNHFTDWDVYFSSLITENKNYISSREFNDWLKHNASPKEELHLANSVRSFRTEKLSRFVFELLEINIPKATELYREIKKDYPIYITRKLEDAKKWLKNNSRGTERVGIIASSGARRLRPCGIDVKNEMDTPMWFLNDMSDVRSSYFLELVATEFDIQGLEIDWACLAWGANFYIENEEWKYQNFKGSKWQNINQSIKRDYLKNTYRVLLTRARQGMVIYLPEGNEDDHTRLSEYYDETWNYFQTIGIQEL